MPPDRSPDAFIVGVLGPRGTPVGVGFLVGPREVVTCAHVVNAALGLDPRAQARPEGTVTVRFPLLEASDVEFTAGLRAWAPPPLEGATGDDIAGLLLSADPAPIGAAPATLAAGLPALGTRVRVFGYAGTPPRPDGAWVATTVQGRVERGRLQIESGVDAALRVQPGYSGGPVCEEASGLVVGMVAAAAPGRVSERDSYAIAPRRIRLAWPEVLAPPSTAARAPAFGRRSDASGLTVLHVSDLQFGRHHLFGGNGRTPADRAHDTLHAGLHEDLSRLADRHNLRPDVIVVTGDLAEWGVPSELDQAFTFVADLADAVGLARHRVAIVPGNHDVNRAACESYFKAQEAEEKQPTPPYYPKWTQFAARFNAFYADVAGVTFTPDEPWTLFEMHDLSVVVAGLNSTMAESHRESDHFGWIGEEQVRWFAKRLAAFQQDGWLRLAAVHHNAIRGAVLDEENLRDADDLDRVLGEPRLVNLLLHGHTHTGRLTRLGSGLISLATGSAAVAETARPTEVPNQYQIVRINRGALVRYARQYARDQRRWIGDNRVSPSGSDWSARTQHTFANVDATFPRLRGGRDPRARLLWDPVVVADGAGASGDDLLARVAEATKVSHPHATVTPRPGYLRVSNPLPETAGVEMWPVGVVDGPATDEALNAFLDTVHARFAAADPSVRSELVHAGPPAPVEMVVRARARGVRLRSFVDYQGLLDLRPLVARQDERLAQDRIYPPSLYVAQRYRIIGMGQPGDVRDDVAVQVTEWLSARDARLVMVLGDFGRGKTSLLRHLARTLPRTLPDLLPVLVELRSLEKAPSLDELLGQHLIRHGVEDINPAKLRYMVRSGRRALLFDGFDELELRVGYDNAADYLQTLLESVADRAKVVLTSRTQHFQSTDQVRTALGDRVASRAGSRIVVLADFAPDQILRFLTNFHGGDAGAARARLALMAEIEDLVGLASNPRMLGFIAALAEDRLLAIRDQAGRISAADLYRELVDFWLVKEADRQRHRGGTLSFDEAERLAACTRLAERLWASTQLAIPMADLPAEVSATLTRLAERGYSVDQAAHTIGSGSLLVRTDEGTFTFVHQSVMEWLVADTAAAALSHDREPTALTARALSRLMVDFLIDQAGADRVRAWAARTLADADASEVSKQNAVKIGERLKALGVATEPPRQNLAGVDLRGQDLNGRDLRGADLTGAILAGMRLKDVDLSGADLSRADLGRVRMVGGSLAGAIVDGTRWDFAALLGVRVDGIGEGLAAAAVAGRDPATVQVAGTGGARAVAFSPDGRLLAIGRDDVVEIVDLRDVRVVRTLGGHADLVTGVAFSADGAYLATIADDGTARSWGTTTGRPHSTLAGHRGRVVTRAAFLADGTLLATAVTDGTVRLWDVTTNQIYATLAGHIINSVMAVIASADGVLVATASDDYTVRIWNATTGRIRAAITAEDHVVTAAAFSLDGSSIVTGGYDGTVVIWDVATGQRVATIASGHGPVELVAFSPDGSQVATASFEGPVGVWEAASARRRASLVGPDWWVTGLMFSPDGAALAVSSVEGTARIFDLASARATAILTSHVSPVGAVAFSGDGWTLATASMNGTMGLWDIGTSGCPTRKDNEADMMALAFNSDGSLLASVSYDGRIRVRHVATGQTRGAIDGYGDHAAAMALSADGSLVAIASYGGTTRVWDVAAGTVRATIPGRDGRTTVVAFARDDTLVTSSDDGITRVWDVDTEGARAVLARHQGGVRALAVSRDGAHLATGGRDVVRIWDMATEKIPGRVIGHDGGVTAIAFSPDGTQLAVAFRDHVVRTWSLVIRAGGPAGPAGPAGTSAEMRHILDGHAGPVVTLAYSGDGTVLASGSDDGTIRLWNTRSDDGLTLTGHTRPVRAVRFSADGRLLATASADQSVRLWNAATGRTRATLTSHPDPLTAIALSPDGRAAVTTSDRGDVKIWNLATRRAREVLLGHAGPVTAVAFSPDGRLIASSASDGAVHIWVPTTVHVWNPNDASPSASLTGHSRPIAELAFSPDGRMIATASQDATARVWDLTTGQSRATLTGHEGWVTGVAFAPDGALVATSSHDGTARVWDVASGQTRMTFTGHEGRINAVAVSPDGRLVATASDDQTVGVWDLATGRARARFTGHTGPVHDVAFSPDGARLASASEDGTARIWDLRDRQIVTLVPLAGDGFAVLLPDGSYKLSGDPGDTLWWAVKLCRFGPGELDPYVPNLKRLPLDAPLQG